MKIGEYLKLIGYRIGDCSDFGWECFGPNTKFIESNMINDNYYTNCIYNPASEEIFHITFTDCITHKMYEWIHPDYIQKYDDEFKQNNIFSEDTSNDDDDIRVEIIEDIVEKVQCVMDGKEYDPRILVPVDLDEDTIQELTAIAAERGISIDKLIEDALIKSMEVYEQQIKNNGT